MKTKPPEPETLDTVVRKLIDLTGVELRQWQRPVNNLKALNNLIAFLQNDCPNVGDDGEIISGKPVSASQARIILGSDFLEPHEIASICGDYSREQICLLAETRPDLETLQYLRSEGFVLMPGPRRELNLLEVRDIDSEFFHLKTGGWFSKESQIFSREDVVRPGWLAIRKESLVRLPYDQSDFLREDNKNKNVPNAAEATYAFIAYHRLRRKYLFNNVYIKTCSVMSDAVMSNEVSDEACIVVGYFPRYGGLFISSAAAYIHSVTAKALRFQKTRRD